MEHLLPREVPEAGRILLGAPLVAAVDTATRHFLPTEARPREGAGALTACLFRVGAYSARVEQWEADVVRVSLVFEREQACPGAPGEVHFPSPSSYVVLERSRIAHYEGTPWLGWAPGVTRFIERPREGTQLPAEALVALRLALDDLPPPEAPRGQEGTQPREGWDVAVAPGRLPDGFPVTLVSLRPEGHAACPPVGARQARQCHMYAVDTAAGRIVASR